jgi:hypothetical protein
VQLDDPDPAAATSIRMALEARVPANHWMVRSCQRLQSDELSSLPTASQCLGTAHTLALHAALISVRRSALADSSCLMVCTSGGRPAVIGSEGACSFLLPAAGLWHEQRQPDGGTHAGQRCGGGRCGALSAAIGHLVIPQGSGLMPCRAYHSMSPAIPAAAAGCSS